MHRLLYINANVGRAENFWEQFHELMQQSPDIVCLQEMVESYHHPMAHYDKYGGRTDMILTVLKSYWHEYEWCNVPRISQWKAGGNYSDIDALGHYGNVILWKRDKYELLESRNKFIFKGLDTYDHADDTTIPVVIQGAMFRCRNDSQQTFNIMNIHGWYGGRGFGKSDCPQRDVQSHALVDFAQSFGDISHTVLVGDLNLGIKTNALSVIEQGINPAGNAIKNFNIPTTRTKLYGAEKLAQEPYADYVITGTSIEVEDCIVDSESVISDHAPVVVGFSFC